MTGDDSDEGDSERIIGMHPDQLAFWIVAMDAGTCFSFMIFFGRSSFMQVHLSSFPGR